jgi:hypothetical protein
MTAVTELRSKEGDAIPGLEVKRFLIAASGDTYQSRFTNVKAVFCTQETTPGTDLALGNVPGVVASANSTGSITFRTCQTNVVASVMIWGD